jgi:transcriptional regulator with XRE-family HTH domain
LGTRVELGMFLRSRRDRWRPEELGIRPSGQRRRVTGLRREELAPLAGIGVDYYTRLEQGRAGNVSPQVIDALADALQFDASEREYAHNLNRPPRPTITAGPPVVRPAMRHLLASITETPGYILGPAADVIAWNHLAAALFGDFGALPDDRRNWSQLLFLEPSIARLTNGWTKVCRANVAFLRLQTSRHPGHQDLIDLIKRMQTESDRFHRLWEAHDVADKTHSEQLFHHPVAGDLTLSCQAMAMPNEPGQILITYTPEPDSLSAAALRHLTDAPLFTDWTAAIERVRSG